MNFKIITGIVNIKEDHIKICEDINEPLALVCQGDNQEFIVQYLIDGLENEKNKKLLDDIKSELQFYLIDKGEKDPWKYAIYYCGSSANIYSNIHWGYYPKGYKGR